MYEKLKCNINMILSKDAKFNDNKKARLIYLNVLFTNPKTHYSFTIFLTAINCPF